MALEVTEYLLSALSLDDNIRNGAQSTLSHLQNQNLGDYLLSLSVELSNDGKPTESRKVAGDILKNLLDDAAFVQKWLGIEDTTRSQIQNTLVNTLGSSVREASHLAAQLVANVAAIDIPQKKWSNLFQLFLSYMKQPDRPASLKQAIVETIGYFCEKVPNELLILEDVNNAKDALVKGMSTFEVNPEVRLAAVKALRSTIRTWTIFEEKELRKDITQMLYNAAEAEESNIVDIAIECLVCFGQRYSGVNVEKVLKALDSAMDGGEEISLQTYFRRFITRDALALLVKKLLEMLSEEVENQDQEDNMWKIAMAGATGLRYVADYRGDDVVTLVRPFVKRNISMPNSHSREAAIHAFLSIIKGPRRGRLRPLVYIVLDFLLLAMDNEEINLKHTTAWMIIHIFELLYSLATCLPAMTHTDLQKIVRFLLDNLIDTPPPVAQNVCQAISFIAQGYEDARLSPSTLTPHLQDILNRLFTLADRKDGSDSKLRSSAYDTLTKVVRCSDISETGQIIPDLLGIAMLKLRQTLELGILSSSDREEQEELQGSLCYVLHVIIQKLSGNDETLNVVLQKAEQVMSLLYSVFDCHSALLPGEAMLAVSALAYATGQEFIRYMPDFLKYLVKGLQNKEKDWVCSMSVGVTNDIANVLGENMAQYCLDIMSQLISNLQSKELHLYVKAAILSCIGDIAMAIGVHFKLYVPWAVATMRSALDVCTTMDISERNKEKDRNALRLSVLEAYSGLLQGLKSSSPDVMVPYATELLPLIELFANDPKRDKSVTKAAVAVMGDVADALGSPVVKLFKDLEWWNKFLGECLESDDEQLKEKATWTQQMINLCP